MRTRNAETPKSAPKKKTTPTLTKKSAGKAVQTTPETGAGSVTPKSTETKRVSTAKGKQVKTDETTPTSTQKIGGTSGMELDYDKSRLCLVEIFF